MNAVGITLRAAANNDLQDINALIAEAIDSWQLPQRVKRLSAPSYFYNQLDLQHMEIILAVDEAQRILGVAAWEEASPQDLPQNKSGLLLHGIFVVPAHHHQGIGSMLMKRAKLAARQQNLDGLLVKAQSDAIGFFLAQDMKKLPLTEQQRNYENRFWKSVYS